MVTEAEFLARLRTLPLHPGARGLHDDTALVAGLVVTTDTLVEGVHYLATDPPGDVAWKLVAQNLSDLAAKGAVPEGVLLNYPLRACPATTIRTPATSRTPAKAGAQLRDDGSYTQSSITPACATEPRASPGYEDASGYEESPVYEDNWDAAFLVGFRDALATFATPLIGGDTVSLPAHAPRVLTLTALGSDAAAPPRSGAKAGDALWVTGTIGDAGAGLAIARGAPGPAALLAAYRRPQPRLADGRALAPHVHAMCDVSDGLLIDAARIAAASGLAVSIDLAAVPLSAAYRAYAGEDRAARIAAATAGDDYQLLFAAPAGWHPPVPATLIGGFAAGAGLTLHDAGTPVANPPSLGWQHGG